MPPVFSGGQLFLPPQFKWIRSTQETKSDESSRLTSRSGSVRMCASKPQSWRFEVSYSAPSIEEFQAGTVVKCAPLSTGTTTQRKRKPHILAVINECCTGCSGSPACVG